MNGYRVTFDVSIDGVRHEVDADGLGDVSGDIDRDVLAAAVATRLDRYLLGLRQRGETFHDVQYRLRLWAHWMLN